MGWIASACWFRWIRKILRFYFTQVLRSVAVGLMKHSQAFGKFCPGEVGLSILNWARVAVVALSMTVIASGQEVKPPAEPPPYELRPGETPEQMFRRLDVNEDGVLSGSELKGFAATMEIADANRDKRLTLDEFLVALDILEFNKLDKNGDGWLSGNEKAGLTGYEVDATGAITRDAFLTKRLQLSGKLVKEIAATPGPFEISKRLKKTENGLAVMEADGGVAIFPALPTVESVVSGALAIGPDGTFHVLMLQVVSFKGSLYYTSSRDGITWSKPEQMPLPPGWALRAEYQMVVDGSGTPVVFCGMQGQGQMQRPSEYFIGSHSLHVRTISGGRWSQHAVVGAEAGVYGWTPLVDARGAVSVVWCEYFPVIDDATGKEFYGCGSSLVRWAGIQNGAPVQTMNLFQPNVVKPDRKTSYNLKMDAYERPRGYIGADGSVHLILERVRSVSGKEEDCGLVYLTGSGPSLLLPFKVKGGSGKARYQFPPALYPGAGGAECLITRTEAPEPFALLCHSLVNGRIAGEPVKIFAASTEKGTIPYPGFASFDGSRQGEVFIGLPYKSQGNTMGQPTDCILLHSDGAGWSPGVDLTNGTLRRKLVEDANLEGYKLPYPTVFNVSVAHGARGERYALVLYNQSTAVLSSAKTKYVSIMDSPKPAFMIVRWGN